MKKLFGGIFALVAVLIVAAALVVYFGWSSVPDMLASRLAGKLKVQVTIDDVHVTMDTIDVQKIDIGNPPGYNLPRAFSAEQILVAAPLTNYLHDEIVINTLEIDNIYLGLEFDKQGSQNGNWTVIMANLKSDDATASTNKTVLIKKLILNNINITLAYKDGSRSPRKISPIRHLEFDNVTSEKGIPTEQITKIIMREMLKSVFSLEGIQSMVEGFLESPQKGVENILRPFFGG